MRNKLLNLIIDNCQNNEYVTVFFVKKDNTIREIECRPSYMYDFYRVVDKPWDGGPLYPVVDMFLLGEAVAKHGGDPSFHAPNCIRTINLDTILKIVKNGKELYVSAQPKAQ